MRTWAAVLLLGCQLAPAPPVAPPGLVAVGAPRVGPEATDMRPRQRVVARSADGQRRPVDREAIGFVSGWGGAGALVDPTGRLYAVDARARRRMLARHATGTLSTDGARLAYVTERAGRFALDVHDGRRPVRWVDGFASVGALALDGEQAAFVGAPPGGVVGVWLANARGARCVTNCGLRVGRPLGDRFAPAPAALHLAPDRLTWTDGRGLGEVPR